MILREVVEVADDEGEDADIERLLDQAREHVLVGRHRPEEAGQGDVDGDQHAGEPADIALHEAEAGIDVLGEDAQEIVDDAGAAHVAYRSSDLAAAFGSLVGAMGEARRSSEERRRSGAGSRPRRLCRRRRPPRPCRSPGSAPARARADRSGSEGASSGARAGVLVVTEVKRDRDDRQGDRANPSARPMAPKLSGRRRISGTSARRRAGSPGRS